MIYLAFGMGVVSVGHSLEDYLVLPHLVPFLILWTILPPTCGWKRVNLTDKFFASLKRIDIAPDDDDCTICLDTCDTGTTTMRSYHLRILSPFHPEPLLRKLCSLW